MKHFFLMTIVAIGGLLGQGEPLLARDYGPHLRPFALHEASQDDAERERRVDHFVERRERMRALREEMLRAQPRPQLYREDEARRMPERREFTRPPAPPPARESEMREGLRRLSPEERRQLRRQLHDAGRDVYHDQ
jgi:hypothetical protein